MRNVFVAAGLLFAAMVLAAQSASAATHRGHYGHHAFGQSRHAAHGHYASRTRYRRAAGRYGHHRRTYASAGVPAAPVAAAAAAPAHQPVMTGFGLMSLGAVAAPIEQAETRVGVAARSVAVGLVRSVRTVVGAQVGGASYYGGRSRTASGGHVGAATCAHRSLPFGTRVLVTNLNNSRQAVLTVNDRGPFVRGRIVDVSTAAAGTLGMLHSGTARVSVQVVGGPG